MAYVAGKSGYYEFTEVNKQFYWKVNWSESYDVALNASIVQIDSIEVKNLYYGGTWYSNALIYINGELVAEMNYYKPTHQVRLTADNVYNTMTPYGSNTPFPFVSSPIPHNTDGSKSITIEVKANPAGKNITSIQLYRSDGTIRTFGASQVQSVELTNIPRAATITGAPNFTDEAESLEITYSNPAGNAVDKLEVCVSLTSARADIAYQEITNKTGSSYTITLTEADRELLRQNTLDGSASRSVYFILQTTIAGNTYRSPLEKTFTVVNADPQLSALVLDTNQNTVDLTGDAFTTVIKGYSNVAYEMSATALKGASIVSYSATNGSTTFTDTIGLFTNVNSNVFKFLATDNRGLSAQKEITLNLIDYWKPTCNIETTLELDGETTARAGIKISGEFFNGSFGAENNSIDILVKHSASNGEWVSLLYDLPVPFEPTIDGNSYYIELGISELDYSAPFTCQAKVVDALAEVFSAEVTKTIYPVFDWSNEDFNFNVPVSFQGTSLLDLLHPIGSVYISRSATHPSTIFGGVWREIKDKFILAAGDVYASGSTGGEASHKLTISEMPSHKHGVQAKYGSTAGDANYMMLPSPNTGSVYTYDSGSGPIGYTGGGAAHNNMPPYLALYMWERIRG